jgi:hypothetical protein
MHHRHLNHEQYTLATIDDIVARGQRQDWAELRRALIATPSLRNKLRRVCQAHTADPYAQRYHFWLHTVEQTSA